jgi:putative tricarboxylic transport membrane protein
MAVLLGAFLVHGIQPGPLLIREHPEIFWGVIASMYLGNVMLLVLNLPLIGLWVQLLKIPYGVLFPLILLFCIIGVYTVSTNIWDIVIMLVFGALGYVMRKFDYEPMPLVLAYVLGRMAEESIRQTLLLSRGSAAIFLERPIATAFLGAAAAVVALPVAVPGFRTALGRLARLREA